VSGAADRGTWRLIAARDFWVRLRERSFLISTLLNVGVISVLVLARASGGFGGAPSFDLGAVGGPDVVAVANAAASLGHAGGVTVRVQPFPDRAAADAALREGSVDAVVTDTQLYGLESVDPRLEALVQTSAHQAAVDAVFAAHHVPESERTQASLTDPLALGALQPAPPDRQSNAAVAFIGVLLLYGQLFGYGLWVATGVIEEKASRVVEMLLSAVRPRQLLAGKIVGIGVLGLAQLITIAGFAICLALATGTHIVTSTAIWAALLVIGWFILGYAFYASLFAAHSRYELLGSTPTFAGMALVTITAGLLAVRREAFVVAILGLAGGFLTPYLLATNEDHPIGLFLYVLLLDLGAIAVARSRRWLSVVFVALGATAILFAGWSERHIDPSKAPGALAAAALLAAVFCWLRPWLSMSPVVSAARVPSVATYEQMSHELVFSWSVPNPPRGVVPLATVPGADGEALVIDTAHSAINS